MSKGNNLQFSQDLQGFMAVVMNHDFQARSNSFSNFMDFALCEIIRYGIFNDQNMISPLRQFYQQYVMKAPKETRFEIYWHVKGMVENTDFVSANAFLPFIIEDNGRQIVSTATIDYVSLAPLTVDDPMSRVKDITGMIERASLRNEGAAFGALLFLGDDRVCALLVPLRDTLDENAVKEATNCVTGLICSSTVDFYCDWLEGMEDDGKNPLFGLVASGLAIVAKRAMFKDSVFTGRRVYPVNGVSLEERAVLMNPVPIADYRRKIAGRLHRLERAEAPPRVMPHVVAEWGLEPVTDPAKTADMGDTGNAEGAPTGGRGRRAGDPGSFEG